MEGKTYDDLFNISINQTSSLVSYIIIKGMFLNNYQIIWDHFELLHNNKLTQYKDFTKICQKLINKSSLNSNLINKIISLLKDDNNCIFTTLRMVLHDL